MTAVPSSMPGTWLPATASEVSASSPKMLAIQADENPSSAARRSWSASLLSAWSPLVSTAEVPIRMRCLRPPAASSGAVGLRLSLERAGVAQFQDAAEADEDVGAAVGGEARSLVEAPGPGVVRENPEDDAAVAFGFQGGEHGAHQGAAGAR